MESEIQYGRSFVDQHCRSVSAEDLDLLIVGIAGLKFIDVSRSERTVLVCDAAVDITLIVGLRTDK